MNHTINRHILVIDDNHAVHDDFRKILASQDEDSAYSEMSAALLGAEPASPARALFQIDSAFQGQEGLGRVQQSLASNRPYALAFVDVRMPPGWDGIETTARIWEADPAIQIVICTAYSDYSWEEMANRLGQHGGLVILKKPFDTIEVLQLAETLTRKWTLARQAELRLADLDEMVNQRTSELTAANQKLAREMDERSRIQEQLRQSQKLEAIGQLAGGVAHDFNNLLAVIRGNADLVRLQNGALTSEAGECLDQIIAASDRAANLTRQLLAFSRKQMMQSHPVALNDVVINLTKMLKRIIGENIDLQCRYAAGLLSVQADIGMLEQVLVNLVVNARDAMPNGGQLVLQTEQLAFDNCQEPGHPEARPGKFVCLTVKDTGTGIAPEHLPRIFEPFFTTKDVGKGTGLGLATVYGIVKQHQGWVEVLSQVGAGSVFNIFLPALQATAVSPAEPVAKSKPRGGNETLLLVEDEESVRSVTRRLLEKSGYRVLEAASGPEAFGVWEKSKGSADLLLTDIIMPDGINGRELAEKLREQKQTLKVVFQSGYSGEILGSKTDYLLQTHSYFLPKPCAPDDLLNTVRRCLDEVPQ